MKNVFGKIATIVIAVAIFVVDQIATIVVGVATISVFATIVIDCDNRERCNNCDHISNSRILSTVSEAFCSIINRFLNINLLNLKCQSGVTIPYFLVQCT